jgi:preprotein translocase subunit SecA
MAGRGTDIKLLSETTKAGGLHVIGTERHTARRIDNQLRGRGGRQGDPGSSRFYVSLQDELMKMFAGEWTIKVLGWLGMEDGMAIEDKRISKGILRAQKKVEERNFLARKNLLEYDEVMDHQRTTFYGMRQKVLRGQNIDGIIWDMIGQAIADAVDKYITQDYIAATVAEWARVNFDVTIDPVDLHGKRKIDELEAHIKYEARAEADTNITATLGEFMGEDEGESRKWDTKGLQSWAMSRFQVNLSQNQLRQMSDEEIEETLRKAALEQIDHRNCDGLMKYLDTNFAEQELANWARQKFGIEIKPEEFVLDPRGHNLLPADQIIELIDSRARSAYARREIEYPVEHALTFAYGGPEGFTDHPYSAEYIQKWAKRKYDVDMPLDEIRSGTLQKLHEKLVAQQRRFLTGGEMDKTVEGLIASNKDTESLRKAFNNRVVTRLTPRDFEVEVQTDEKDMRIVTQPASAEQVRQLLLDAARQVMREELTDLEQFVLVQILDQSWKDHLYAMDMMKNGIGLLAFAEQDPRVQYKKEGFRYFQEMMGAVRDKVTDLIFRARVVGATQSRNAYRETAAVHEAPGGYGVAENIAETAAATSGKPPGEMQEAASERQGEGATVKTIVREAPKVGRNDLCPCGSGKKYKKCCGVAAA